MKIDRAEPMLRHNFRSEEIGLVDSLFFKQERQRQSLNRQMFDDDFAGLFNPVNRRSGSLFDIESNDDELIQKLLGNVKTRYAPDSADETIRELVEEIAQSLISFGSAYYFIHDDTEKQDVYVVSFSSSGVMRLFGTFFQWIPKRWERKWDQDDVELPREIRILDASKVMCLDIPKTIKRMLFAQNRTLTVLDNYQSEIPNNTTLATHKNPNPTNHFDFQEWSDTQELALQRAVRKTGWDGRKHSSSMRSDFFICHRLIRFRRNQLLLRDDILNQLSSELSRIGKGYKAEFWTEISGSDKLPSVENLNELETKLEREEIDFNEIIDYCYKR